MRLPAILSSLVGLAALITLVVMNGATQIEQGIAAAGWSIAFVVILHLPQVAFSSLGWRAVVSSARLPSRSVFFGLRLIREAVNGLLPVAQIGGDLVAARLLTLGGVPLSMAGASVTVDRTLELLTQVAFTILGVGLLIASPESTGLPRSVTVATIAVLGGLAVIFLLAQRFGVFRLLETSLLRLARKRNWKALEAVAGLHQSIVGLYKSPRRLLLGGGLHFISWLLGGLEVLVGLQVLGVTVDFREALIIESLGQAFRAMGFAVPGGLGVQEGGVILICGLMGIGPQSAIELSLLRRFREVVLGVPGLLAWYWVEAPRAARTVPSKEELTRETTS
ncbi:MAG: flippase-like domain-containing protein [Aliidongia sp.]